MSLQGSLETFEIPDVLVLLSSTKKTGELRVVGGQVDGRVWFDAGSIVQASVGGAPTTAVDGVFEILRLVQGTFSFESDIKAPKPADGKPVDIVLADAQGRLSEWRDIAKVVPHLDCLLSLSPELPDDEVTVGRSQWQIMVKVAGGCSVRQLMDASGLSEFDACKSVRDLIDGGLLAIDTSVKPRSGRAEAPKGMSVPVDEAVANGNANGKADAPASSNGAKANGSGESAAPAESKSGGVTAEKKPTTAADEARKEGKDAQVIRSHSAAQGAAAVSTSKGSPATAPLDDEEAKEAKAAKAAAKITEQRTRDADKAAGKPGSADDKDDDTNPLVAQLAALGVDEDDEEMQERVAKHLAEGGELPQPEGDEPINRGLLLKFLSSVRN